MSWVTVAGLWSGIHAALDVSLVMATLVNQLSR